MMGGVDMATPWLSRKDLAASLGCSTRRVDSIVKGIRNLIPDRYDRYVLAGTRINYYAAIDYMTYENEFSDENMKKFIPDFDPGKISFLAGGESTL